MAPLSPRVQPLEVLGDQYPREIAAACPVQAGHRTPLTDWLGASETAGIQRCLAHAQELLPRAYFLRLTRFPPVSSLCCLLPDCRYVGVDSAKALPDVENDKEFVAAQSQTAIRALATCYLYDSHKQGEESLRGNPGENGKR